jgi:nucleoid DNA-binding protein
VEDLAQQQIGIHKRTERGMTKSELVSLVVNRKPKVTRKDAEIYVDTVFDNMLESLARGERIEIRGFGSKRVGD